jgi:hypothetical protein
MKRNLCKRSGIKFILFTLTVGICFLSAGQTAMADSYAYYTAAGGVFGTLDLTTGNTVGSTFYLGYAPNTGFGVANGTLYNLEMVVPFNSLVHSIDPVAQTTSALYYTLPAVQYPPIGSANDVLYTILHAQIVGSNGQARYDLTSITSTGINTIGTIMQIEDLGYVSGLSNSSSALYFSLADKLYTANTTTGAGALIGLMGSGLGIGSMVFEDGTLYGAGSGGKIYTINTTTGTATLLSNTGFDIIGLAPAPAPVPIPAAIWLLGSGLVGLIGIRRFRRQLPNS